MKIKCKTKDKLPLEALADFQGNLKRRTEIDYKKNNHQHREVRV